MIAIAVLAAALFTQATVATPASASPAAAKTAPSDLVCRTEPDPGSRFTHKVCLTRAQLQDRRASARGFIEDVQQRSQSGPAIVMMGPPS